MACTRCGSSGSWNEHQYPSGPSSPTYCHRCRLHSRGVTHAAVHVCLRGLFRESELADDQGNDQWHRLSARHRGLRADRIRGDVLELLAPRSGAAPTARVHAGDPGRIDSMREVLAQYMPVGASEHAVQVDTLNAAVHWLMLVLFFGCVLYFLYVLRRCHAN